MKKIITLLLAMAATSIFSATVMAAGETIDGFYDIGTDAKVVITPYAGETAVTMTEKNIDEDDAMEKIYVDSDKLEVTYGSAAQNKFYSIILVDGSGLPTKDTTIYYINQDTASASDVKFNVCPKIPEETTDMTLYISSNEEDFSLVSIPMNYAVNETEVSEGPSYIPGDANSDTEVDVKDVIAIRRHIAGGYSITINEAAANVNGDALVDVKDAIAIRRYIAGGYDVELK